VLAAPLADSLAAAVRGDTVTVRATFVAGVPVHLTGTRSAG
jgi:hypothetical protein